MSDDINPHQVLESITEQNPHHVDNTNPHSVAENAITEEVVAIEDRLNETGVLNQDLIDTIKQQVKAQLVAELKEDKYSKQKELEYVREIEDIEHQKYIAMMKESDDPWVEFVGDVRDTVQGQRLQMEWNDAFIKYLKDSGIAGADEEQIVQKYISLVMRDMNDKMEKRYGSDYE